MIIHPPPVASSSKIFRIKRGSKLSDLPPSSAKDVPPLTTFDGPFQISEYLALRIKADPHDVSGILKSDPSTDQNVWIYEHLRRIPIDLAVLMSYLLPVCNRQCCPSMKAGEWLYLCVAHGQAGEGRAGAQSPSDCCAIDYILHTLDSTTAILNSTSFPSRLSIPPASVSHFPSLLRRLSRIFSHAYFHHREAFQLAENETSLYARFSLLCQKYNLVEAALLPIPSTYANSADREKTEEEESSATTPGEEADDDSDESDDDGPSERGRDKSEVLAGTKRPHSLDRHAGPHEDLRSSPKPEANTEMKAAGVASTKEHVLKVEKEITPRAEKMGTLSRGKQSRGTMLWSSEPDPTTVTESDEMPNPADPESEHPLERIGSTDTAIHLPSMAESEESGAGSGAAEPEPSTPAAPVIEPGQVPKDEIELLEEQGKLPAEPSVSPLPTAVPVPPSSPPTTAPAGEPSEHPGDMVDVKLEDDVPEAAAVEPAVGVASAAPPPVSPKPSVTSLPLTTPSSPLAVPAASSPLSTASNGSNGSASPKLHKTSTPLGSSPLAKVVSSSPLAQEVKHEEEVEEDKEEEKEAADKEEPVEGQS